MKKNRLNYALLFIGLTTVIVLVSGHFIVDYYWANERKNLAELSDPAPNEITEKNGQAEKLMTADMAYLELVQNHNILQMQKAGVENPVLSGIEDIRRESTVLHGENDDKVIHHYVTGCYFFVKGRYRDAQHHFKAALDIYDLPSVELMLGLSLDALGQDPEAFDAYMAGARLAETMGGEPLKELSGKLVENSSFKKQRSIIYTVAWSFSIFAVLATVIAILFIRRQMGQAKNGPT